MMGAFQMSGWLGAGLTTGIILSAAYSLYLYRRVVYGTLTKPDVMAMPDLSTRELAILLPVALAVLWMGVHPSSFQDPLRAPVALVLKRLDTARPPQVRVTLPRTVPAKGTPK